MFYCLVLKHVIPHSPTVSRTKKKGAQSNIQCEIEFCESLNHQLEALLKPQDFQIAFDRKTGVRQFEEQQSTYLIPFLASKIYVFKADDIIIPKPGYAGFKVETKTLSSVQETLAQDIRDALCSKVAIHKCFFSMATSRSFGFEIYYEGSFRVKREFSDDDIESAGGVRDALESFFDEIASAIEPFGLQVTSTPARHRRSRDNEYLFGVYYAPVIAFSESAVHGEGCYAIKGDSSTDEINEYGVDFDNILVDETNAFLNSILDEMLPPNADLISSDISYIDDSEEAFDICDELICSHESHLDDTDSAEDVVTETHLLDNTASQANGYASRTATASRFRIARADATVETISKKIEKVFGLPEGAVALCGPDGRALGGDTRIATLRQRWEKKK